MRFQLSRHKRQATGDEVRSTRIPHTNEWNGQTRCVCVCVSEQKGKPSCSTGGGLGDRKAYIHKDLVCVCMAKRKTILFHGGEGDSPSSLARTHSWKTTQNRRRDILFHRGGRGEYTMTSITY